VVELDPTSCYRKTELPMTKLFELKVLLDPDGIIHYVIQLNMYLFWKYVPDGNLSKKKEIPNSGELEQPVTYRHVTLLFTNSAFKFLHSHQEKIHLERIL
jgi:hypothetical protein